MNPIIMQWVRFWLFPITLALFVTGSWIYFELSDSPEPTVEEELTRSHVAQLQEQFSIPEMTCKQLFGEDRRYQDPRPQVECEADRPGFFFWQDINDGGDWEVFYYNQYPTEITGFMFTTNPEEVKITFKDMRGNETESVVEIVSDFKPCTLENGCSRVEHVI